LTVGGSREGKKTGVSVGELEIKEEDGVEER